MKTTRSFAYTALALLVASVCPATLFAADIFVDKTLPADIVNGTYSVANRNAGGRDGNAFRTVKAAVAAMAAGDTCYLRGGTYYESGISLSAKSDGSATRAYTISSYPGEWAIVDGNHASTAPSDQSIFMSGATLSYWRFTRLEITGAGKLSPLPNYGAAIHLPARHSVFQYLYIHDNFASTVNAGAAAGMLLLGGSQNNLVEHCWFRGNGNPLGDVNTANANLAIYSDYKYDATVDPNTASIQNEVRFNLFEGVGSVGRTPVGFVHKGFQRLTGFAHGEMGNAVDAFPNDARYRASGDRIHHNIFIGHAQAARLDQDYVQFYNNIVDIDLAGAIAASDPVTATERFAAVRTSDAFTSRRGSFWPSVYNNTIIANGGQALTLTIVKGSWDCLADGAVSDYSRGFAPNNIIDSADNGYDWKAATVNSASTANCTGSQPHDLTRFSFSRTLVFNAEEPAKVLHFERAAGDLTIAAAVAAGAADTLWSRSGSGLYLGSSGAARYTPNGTYQLDTAWTVANGGLGGRHPYLDSPVPGYVGAVDPSNASWVSTVLGLASAENLKKNAATPPPAKPTGVMIIQR